METHKFKLSGVDVEITHLGGAQQGILTNNKSVPMSEKLIDLVKSIVLKVGTVDIQRLTDSEKTAFFSNMLDCHIKQILVEARQFTYGEDDFVFTFDYEKEVNGKKTKVSEEMVMELGEGFPVKPVKKFDRSKVEAIKTLTDCRNMLKTEFEPLECSEYSEVVENSIMEFTQPKSGYKTRMSMRNVKSTAIVASIKRKDMDANISILCANPQIQLEDGGHWIQFDMRKIQDAHALDLEVMRFILRAFEGSVDTELEFEHPETGKPQVTDLISQLPFFFPSGGL